MLTKRQFTKYIREGDFGKLFILELGWDRYRGPADISVTVDDQDFRIRVIAHKRGFQILHCDVDDLPTQSIAKKIDTKLRKQAMDYICIFHKRNTTEDVWVVPVRSNEKRSLVLVEYSDDKVDFLYQKIDGFTFSYDDNPTIVDLRAKVQTAFAVNSEKITKDFYVGFKKHHKAFTEFITGMDDNIAPKENRSKQWYASVMLNRLMFCYFIQKKGFLDRDVNYLRHKLNWVRENEGSGKFYDFYRGFLRQLFHDGLNAPQHSPEFRKTYGRIPYLNGGMFEHHILERRYPDIDIPDEAFESLFKFFDEWRWHLDTRMTASGKDINPDVLGYIFEQYINDRAQMGAYYTKEDITEYIGRNCILPFLFDKVRNVNKKDFNPDGFVWRFLRESGDRYIFDAVKKGSEDFDGIPDNIKRGIITPEMHKEYAETPVGNLSEGHVPLAELRKDWNTKTPDIWGLPNEIWRESIERMQRCRDILGKIERGDITSINDFITYNLDIRSFASDLLLKSEDSVFVKHFYEALKSVTILDPTCGSGAFLFAAMNILEPLYEICITRMQEMNEGNPHLFKKELEEINSKYRSNIQYFIYKSIILRNLYGVDIMAEATEIAKLRLFLKMVAVVDVDPRADNLGLDPLPDIDFNIRCGNTLVGYANKQQLEDDLSIAKDIFEEIANQELKEKIEDEVQKVASAYELFVYKQLHQEEDNEAFKQAKADLRTLLNSLNTRLNCRLFLISTGYKAKEGEDITKSKEYRAWLKSHQPFHWFSEFYQIIEGNGGFDVIIGNPPYVEKRQINYEAANYETWDSGAVHSMCIERSLSLLRGSISMIVPIALVCTQRMVIVQKILEKECSVWYSNYAWRPAHLFDNVSRALTIFICHKSNVKSKYSTNYIKWKSEDRTRLFPQISYVEYSEKRDSFWMPKFGNTIDRDILVKLLSSNYSVPNLINIHGEYPVYYRTTGGVYWKTITTWSPKFYCNGKEMKSSRETSINFDSQLYSECIAGILSSNVFWWWYTITGNLRDLNPSDINGFKFPSKAISKMLSLASKAYLEDINNKSVMQRRMQKTKGETITQLFKIGASKYYIDQIDIILAHHYGFSSLELDRIVNYDIKYRLRDEPSED